LHSWVYNAKPNHMANNRLKYLRIDPIKRAKLRAAWNRPVIWPIGIIVGLLVVVTAPAVVAYRKRESRASR